MKKGIQILFVLVSVIGLLLAGCGSQATSEPMPPVIIEKRVATLSFERLATEQEGCFTTVRYSLGGRITTANDVCFTGVGLVHGQLIAVVIRGAVGQEVLVYDEYGSLVGSIVAGNEVTDVYLLRRWGLDKSIQVGFTTDAGDYIAVIHPQGIVTITLEIGG